MSADTETLKLRIRAKWEGDGGGKLSCPGKPDVRVAIRPALHAQNVEEEAWTLEDLFAGALNICFMAVFLEKAASEGLRCLSFDCEVEGTLARPGGRFFFTHAHLSPRVILPGDGDEELARSCLKFSKKDCLISHFVGTDISMEPQVVRVPAWNEP